MNKSSGERYTIRADSISGVESACKACEDYLDGAGVWSADTEARVLRILIDAANPAQLSGDVLAFVAEVEARAIAGTSEANALRLCQIVREQVAQLREHAETCVIKCASCSRFIVGIDQDLARCPWCESNAIRDRLAKLEAAARRTCEFFVAEDECECDGCVITRELGSLLEAKTNP